MLADQMGPMAWRMVWKNHFSDLPVFEGYPFARAENSDIQSQVLLRPFWTQNPNPKWPGNCNPSNEKRCRLAHFEARELSYPKMTFPGPFWNLQNQGLY